MPTGIIDALSVHGGTKEKVVVTLGGTAWGWTWLGQVTVASPLQSASFDS